MSRPVPRSVLDGDDLSLFRKAVTSRPALPPPGLAIAHFTVSYVTDSRSCFGGGLHFSSVAW